MSWKYDLGDCGKMLRHTIENCADDAGGCMDTLDMLRACYAKVKELIPADDYDLEFAEMEDEMEIIRSGIEFGDDDDDDAVVHTDYALSIFYDLCDAYRIWISA